MGVSTLEAWPPSVHGIPASKEAMAAGRDFVSTEAKFCRLISIYVGCSDQPRL